MGDKGPALEAQVYQPEAGLDLSLGELIPKPGSCWGPWESPNHEFSIVLLLLLSGASQTPAETGSVVQWHW